MIQSRASPSPQNDEDLVYCLPPAQRCAGQPRPRQAQRGESGAGGGEQGPDRGPAHQHHQGHGHQPDQQHPRNHHHRSTL